MQHPATNPTRALSTSSRNAATAIEVIRASGESQTYAAIRKERDRSDLRAKLQAMLDIDHLIETQQMRKSQAVSITAARLKPFHNSGFSVSTLQKLHTLWKKGGQKEDAKGKRSGPIYQAHDWKIFIKNYTNGKTDAAINNPEFVAHVQSLNADTTRDDATGNALRERLLDDWCAGKHVPGYGNIYEFCARAGRPVPQSYIDQRRPQNHPEGWSAKNLLRMIPDKTTNVYLRHGEHAAHSHWGDQLLRDRSKLMPLQLITFDDVRFDIRVIMEFPNRDPQIVYPEALFCLDVSTGLILSHAVTGNYLRAEDVDGGKKGVRRGLQQADMRWFLKSILELYGIPCDWQMNILLENASASLSPTDQRIFEELTGVRFENTGIIRQKLTKSGFVEQGGMPWQKGWIEAYFRLLHCRINHLPMTVGRRYDLTPGRIGNKSKAGSHEHYIHSVIKEAKEKNIPLSELRYNALTLPEFHNLLDEYVRRLNWRTSHNLQGFADVYEYEINPGQHVRTDDPQQGHLIPLGARTPKRKEAPAERAARLTEGHRFEKVHPEALRITGMHKSPITVAAQRVKLDLPGEKGIQFRDAENAKMLAKYNGQKKALVGLLAHDNSCIHLYTNDDAFEWVGSPKRVGLVDITDQHAIDVRKGEVHRGRQQVRDYASEILAPQEAKLAADRAHNTARLATPAAENLTQTIRTAEATNAKAQAQENVLNKKVSAAEIRRKAERTKRLADIARNNI
ncbi:hypothetical protein ACWPKS_15800 [Coraliomargarita sp. W4R72]